MHSSVWFFNICICCQSISDRPKLINASPKTLFILAMFFAFSMILDMSFAAVLKAPIAVGVASKCRSIQRIMVYFKLMMVKCSSMMAK